MKFIVDPSLDFKIHDAAELASRFLMTRLDIILAKDRFTHTNDSPEIVFNAMASYVSGDNTVEIKAWKPWNRWTSAIATTYPNKPGLMFINVRKTHQFPVANYVGTICHEISHLAGYSHGSNNPKGKENSVPYWIGNQAKDWANG